MVRYIMTFTAPRDRQDEAQQIIDDYFEELYRHGPAGMRSQCYATQRDDGSFVHIKSFKRESIANHHFRSAVFLNYVQRIAKLCGGDPPSFTRLNQQQTFESIY